MANAEVWPASACGRTRGRDYARPCRRAADAVAVENNLGDDGRVRACPVAARPLWQICAIDRPGYIHAAAFSEIVEAVFHGLLQLDLRVELVRSPRALGDRAVLIGAHLLSAEEMRRGP